MLHTKLYEAGDTRGYVIDFRHDKVHAGECTLRDRGGKVIELWNFAIFEDYRGIGLGKQFLEELIDFAIDKEYIEFGLYVSKSNKVALRLYSGCGFDFVEGKCFIDNPSIPYMRLEL